MFDKFLRFFLLNARLNYLLFVLIFALGVYAYINTPKEIFPTFELDKISVSGSYSGASVDILDKMAVSELEDDFKSIDGIVEMNTEISPGRFSIVMELQKGKNRYNIADKVKDAVALNKSDLPSDMDEPTVRVIESSRNLMDITLLSKNKDTTELKTMAKELESRLMGINNIAEVTIYGDSDMHYEVLLHDGRIDALGLNKQNVINAVSSLSYTFPVGKIEDSSTQHYYVSTDNGPKTAKAFEDSVITVGDKKLKVGQIAQIQKRYEDASTLFSVDGKQAMNVVVKQDEDGNAIEIDKDIQALVAQLNKNKEGIEYLIKDNDSERIKDRLNIVISNILLGIILITLLVMLLVNVRLALIIAIGIPTSFVIGALYFYLSGYTINMVSLVGVLIALGIIVDDAIVVSENIQQHLEEGYSPKDAALLGAKDMFKPVTLATFTTLFSFIPILMISGTLGEVIKLIPIAFSALVIASLIESFVFLPIHASHILKNKARVRSWAKINELYSKVIHLHVRYKKTFLLVFIIMVPVLTLTAIKSSKFQMFPSFDASSVNITIKHDVNTKVEETFETVSKIEKDLLGLKDEYAIDSVSSVAGYRRNQSGEGESYPYVSFITIELHKLKPDNFVDKYVTPYLSFYYDEKGRSREMKSQEISRQLRSFLEEKNYKDNFGLKEISVLERRVGPVKTDVQIGLSHANTQLLSEKLDELKGKISELEGIKSVTDNATLGVDEIKLKVNEYGQKLGITEEFLGSFLVNSYLNRQIATSFDSDDMLEIKTQSMYKDDFNRFKRFRIPLEDGRYVRLEEVAQLKVKHNFEKIEKDMGKVNFYVYANVDTDTITATEVLDDIRPYLQQLQQEGIELNMKGEQEKKQDLKNDMLSASSLSIMLILIAMLYMFNSFKQAFIVMSVIPFSLLGMLIGHMIMGMNLTMPSIIGTLGLAGVVINDGIIMMNYLRRSKTLEEMFTNAKKRFRPIILTTITTLIGLSSLIFFPTGQAAIFQPMAVALGFGLAWGTVLNLLYLPALFALTHKLK
ncbi:MAG: efflux RND transporter permease subunit [Campylobacterota bacterium]